MEDRRMQSPETNKEKSKYKSLTEWRKTDPRAYAAAYRRGMLSLIAESFGWATPKKKNQSA